MTVYKCKTCLKEHNSNKLAQKCRKAHYKSMNQPQPIIEQQHAQVQININQYFIQTQPQEQQQMNEINDQMEQQSENVSQWGQFMSIQQRVELLKKSQNQRHQQRIKLDHLKLQCRQMSNQMDHWQHKLTQTTQKLNQLIRNTIEQQVNVKQQMYRFSIPSIKSFDIDSVRAIIPVQSLDRLMPITVRLSCTYSSSRQGSWFEKWQWMRIVDRPVSIFIEQEHSEKWWAAIKKGNIYFKQVRQCWFKVAVNKTWISTCKITEILNKIGISNVYIVAHGLKMEKMMDLIKQMKPDTRNMFDFAMTTSSKPNEIHLLENKNYQQFDNLQFFGMMGFSNIGTFSANFKHAHIKVYSQLVHFLKKKTSMSWTFKEEATIKVVKSRVLELTKLVDALETHQKGFSLRFQASIHQQMNQNPICIVIDAIQLITSAMFRVWNATAIVCITKQAHIKQVKSSLDAFSLVGPNNKVTPKEKLDEFAFILNKFGWAHYANQGRIKRKRTKAHILINEEAPIRYISSGKSILAQKQMVFNEDTPQEACQQYMQYLTQHAKIQKQKVFGYILEKFDELCAQKPPPNETRFFKELSLIVQKHYPIKLNPNQLKSPFQVGQKNPHVSMFQWRTLLYRTICSYFVNKRIGLQSKDENINEKSIMSRKKHKDHVTENIQEQLQLQPHQKQKQPPKPQKKRKQQIISKQSTPTPILETMIKKIASEVNIAKQTYELEKIKKTQKKRNQICVKKQKKITKRKK